ncbi:MAG: LCP family protein [Actinobacteria bacterium]|nr:LCP family protein [Actinomycetota bacterium]MBU4302678.1 LCP family protein [Actinomycetota bacterium]
MRRHAGNEEPELYLDGDQPTIYRKRKIRWTSVLKWGALALAIILTATFILGYIWLKTKESEMRVPGVEEALDPKQKGQPNTTLVMGVDSGSVAGEEGQSRADIIMLVSVDPDTKKAAVISIPRDTRCKIPGQSGYSKMNAAYALGGPELMIKTVKDFTGLNINHFVVIDFEGFKHIVDAVGGVPMHMEVAIHDKYAGDVPAGDVVLNGEQALSLVRARHDINAVPAGDLDRVKNQRMFLQAMLSTVSRQRNPFKVKNLVDVASRNVKTDLTFMEMLSLGRRLQGAGDDGLQMVTAPGDARVMGGAWYYVVDTDRFQELLTTFEAESEVAVDEGEPSTGKSEKAKITVAVLNGAGKTGLAASVAGELEKAGFTGVKTGNSGSRYTRTTIYYADDDSSKAGVVAADLAGVKEPLLEESSGITLEYVVDVVVVLGSDYRGP